MKKILITAIALLGVVSSGAYAQSRNQRQSDDYGQINTKHLNSNEVQRAWNEPTRNMADNQQSPGYTRYDYRPDRVIPLRLREAMNTTIRFPNDELIEDVYVSDPVSFEAIVPRSNVVMIRVIRPGADGNVVAMGRSGNLYQFYVRGEPANTSKITDISVDIMVAGLTRGNGMPANMGGLSRNASASDLRVEADWLRTIGFPPENIVHDLSIFVPSDHSAGVAPERVFRDNQYTYIDYGANADALNEWPVASLVVQGVETPVNVRTAGPNGRMLVVEAVGDIVLRNGMKIVCIKRAAGGRPQIATFNQPVTTPAADVQMVDGQPALPPSVASPSTGRRYLLDLGVGERGALEQQFLTLKAQHSDLLGRAEASFPDASTMRGGPTTGNAATGQVRLRVGPFYALAEGVNICRTLTASGRSCAVVSAN